MKMTTSSWVNRKMLIQEELSKTKFCAYTHNAIHFTTDGKVGFCCLQDFRGFPTVADVDFDNLHDWYLNEPTLKKVRDDLRAGIEHPSCITCWKKEKNNVDSKRTIDLKKKSETKIFAKNNVHIHRVDYRLSNKCNLQCKMCWPGASDQIANLADELTKKGIDHLLLSLIHI